MALVAMNHFLFILFFIVEIYFSMVSFPLIPMVFHVYLVSILSSFYRWKSIYEWLREDYFLATRNELSTFWRLRWEDALLQLFVLLFVISQHKQVIVSDSTFNIPGKFPELPICFFHLLCPIACD